MSKLADSISVQARFARSVYLERDLAQSEPLEGYIVTTRVLDVVERVTDTATNGSAGGAWSLTGPYGSGKSSLALLIAGAFGEYSDIRRTALKLIDEASLDVGNLIREAHKRYGTEDRGFHKGLVTADREPLNRTVLRALHAAVLHRYGKIPSVKTFRSATALRGALKDAETNNPRRTGPSPSALVEIARCLAQDAPLLLTIDEFGKNLEAISDKGDTDPYLLQRLAEEGQGSGLPIFVMTLQHLSFEEHLSKAGSTQRREWAKVQGRFEDVAFTESASQTRALIGTAFKVHGDSLRSRIDRWANRHSKTMRELGISDLADSTTISSCYPLHPLVTLVLPELCNRHGQHERTLFSFLASHHAGSVTSFLSETDLPLREPLPSVGLDSVYDYFVGSNALNIDSAHMSGRWTEIATRLRDSHGLTQPQIQIAKAVALLNLVSTAGTVRASRAVLALTDDEGAGSNASDKTLDDLEKAGLVTYRDFADEYRIWQGTDVDIRLLLNGARRQVKRRSLVDILNEIDRPQPVVAARHSAERDVLRIFSRRYVDASEKIEPPDVFGDHDGELLLVVDPSGTMPPMSQPWKETKPVVAVIPTDMTDLDAAARETATVMTSLDDPQTADDWVVRRELSERLVQAQAFLKQALADTFSSDSCQWVLFQADGERPLKAGRGTAPLSEASDIAYPFTPLVRNEMLNRTKLTSQGAKARRILLSAMIKYGTEDNLGMEGYGPEVAMYQAFLKHTGIHGEDKRNKVMTFRKPSDPDCCLLPAWERLRKELKRSTRRRINLRDFYATLSLPPFGMKDGAIPVLLTAVLIACSDEVAIYEHGTFKPVLTPELSERMVRNPGHFDVRHFANTTGARRKVIDTLTRRFQLQPRFRKHRVANVVAVVGHLVARINRLDNYTRRTCSLRPETLATRKVLMEAVEPDELLFITLPEALGFPQVHADAAEYPQAEEYATAVGDALDELSSCYDHLLVQLLDLLLRMSAESSRKTVMSQAASLNDEVLDPEIRVFVLSLANGTIESDTDWAKAIATIVAKKAPAEWTDHDLERFRHEALQKFSAFHRLLALYADHQAYDGASSNAYRVTVTRSDGSEHSRLVGVDHDLRLNMEAALGQLLQQLSKTTGSPVKARHTLLALFGEQLISESTQGEEEQLALLNALTKHPDKG